MSPQSGIIQLITTLTTENVNNNQIMTLYFSSKSIPQLKDRSIKERQIIIQKATAKLNTPEKLLLNLIKLGILVPMFLYLVWLDGWMLVLPPMLSVLAYFGVYNLILLRLISKRINIPDKISS